jgi:Ran GTPase-activating protein (RanGAP) involved in mRNA processing and transport
MGPKKGGGAAKPGEEVEGEDPGVLLQNYQKFCKTIGLPANPCVAKNLTDEEKFPVKQIIIDDESGPLGPGGTRALMTAVMGGGPGMKGGPYKLLESLRIWRSNAGDDGVAAIAEVLRLGGAEVKISYLELLDNNVGPRGCLALGYALAKGNNVSLLNLNLDYNRDIGALGVANITRGLRTNVSLRILSMQYCGITSEAGSHFCEILSNTKTGLEELILNGNRLGGVGLKAICEGLHVNKSLTKFSIGDNMIDQTDADLDALTTFRSVLMNGTTQISSVDLLYNRIGKVGGEIMLPAVDGDEKNKNISEFLVDISLPMELFEKLHKAGGGKKGKKGGKKGGKKKKK